MSKEPLEDEIRRNLSLIKVIEADNRRLTKELEEVTAKLKALEEQSGIPKEGTAERLEYDAQYITNKIDNFLLNVCGYAYLSYYLPISYLQDDRKKEYISAVRRITAWAQEQLNKMEVTA